MSHKLSLCFKYYLNNSIISNEQIFEVVCEMVLKTKGKLIKTPSHSYPHKIVSAKQRVITMMKKSCDWIYDL